MTETTQLPALSRQCAILAELRGEPMAGSAAAESRFLLIEQPGAWGRNALTESGFDSDVAAQLQTRAARAETKVLLIRQPGRSVDTGRLRWAIAECGEGQSLRWGTYRDASELLGLHFDGSVEELPGEPSQDALYLVCVHSKRDVCCSLRGRPMAQALNAVRPGQVYEASHFGGHRYAANVLALPAGQMYGRVLEFAADDLVAATERGEVLAPLLRGRCGLSSAAQAAVAHAHDQMAVLRADEITVLGQEPGGMPGSRDTVVRLQVRESQVEVVVREEVVMTRASCRDDDDRPEAVYRAMELRALHR